MEKGLFLCEIGRRFRAAFMMAQRGSSALKIQRKVAFPVAALLLVAAALVPPALAQQDNQTDSQVATFQKIEDQWSTAWVSQGQFTLETILDPTFVDISSTGEITSRNQMVASMFENGVPRAQTMRQKVDSVRVIEDVAIVGGTYTETTKLNGIERAEQGVFTHIYQRARGVWKCVQSQRTALPQSATEGKKSHKKKPLF
jgi:hypothetical protein